MKQLVSNTLKPRLREDLIVSLLVMLLLPFYVANYMGRRPRQ